MTEISEDMMRLEEILRIKGIKKSEFMKKMGIESQHYNNWRIRGIPGKKILEVARCVGESAEWIDSGETQYNPIKANTVNELFADYQNSNKLSKDGYELLALIFAQLRAKALTDSTANILKKLVLKLTEAAKTTEESK